VLLALATDAQADVNGCSVLTAVDLRGQSDVTIEFGGVHGLSYSPACIRVDRGTTVTFSGSFTNHPLVGGRVVGSATIPEATSPIMPTSTGTTASFLFSNRGEFGYYCDFHALNAMYGAVLVGDVDSIFADGFEPSDGGACPAAPGSLSGCPSCAGSCDTLWPVNWGAVSGATHYVIEYTCFTATPTYQTSNTAADLCTEVGMCDDDSCSNGVGAVTVKACNSNCCSAPVTFPSSETPIACGGGLCCG
jgi:plastocyanin